MLRYLSVCPNISLHPTVTLWVSIMAPRKSYSDKPMTSAERVQRARWANKVEDTAFKLLDLLMESPEPLPRRPEIPSELLELLKPYSVKGDLEKVKEIEVEEVSDRILYLGNGNQHRNKKVAMQFLVSYFDASQVDSKTIKTSEYGSCHVSAYTHAKGAMISTPNRDDQNYGGAEWHKNDHLILFRDVGDGRCIVYINEIEPLFARRTIGHHGVTWLDIEELAKSYRVLTYTQVREYLN